MQKVHVKNLPIVVNVCEQVLREVERRPEWSMAHVTMNPMAASRLHLHERMEEIYVVTKGAGKLGFGTPKAPGVFHEVVAGSVFQIPAGTRHMLVNGGVGHLEHLVFAFPPFDPADVHLVDGPGLSAHRYTLLLPEVQECFDGAKILAYTFRGIDVSVAFGWVINDPARRKRPHFHETITEFIYVVDGQGTIEVDHVRHPIQSGDWIRVDPGEEHGLMNEAPEDLVVVCMCSPAFRMDDVHYRPE